MGGAWSRGLGVASLVAGLFGIVAAPASARPPPRCRPPVADALNVGCRVAVPLDRSGAVPGTIDLHVRVVGLFGGVLGGTLLVLADGPGEAAGPRLFDLPTMPPRVLRTRRLVVFDQRGTGRSGRLRCPGLEPLAAGPPGLSATIQRAVASCASRLGPARAHYATADTVEDVEAVRAALGVDRLVLYGTGYGSKVALDYAAAHPERVERLLLDSVIPPDGTDPFVRAALGEIPDAMRALCAGGACPFTRDAGADATALAGRLARGPLRGTVVDGHGRPLPARMRGVDLLRLLLAGERDPWGRGFLPAAVRAAQAGDPALLLRLAARRRPWLGAEESDAAKADSLAVRLATTCDDGPVPWAPGAPIADRAAAVAVALAAIPAVQLAPFDAAAVRGLGLADLCRAWPEAPVAQPRAPLPDVPTLILSDAANLRAPRADALALAARLPHAQVLTVPPPADLPFGDDDGECVAAAIAAFFADRPVRACERRRRPSPFFFGRVSLPPRRLRALEPVHGVRPHAGRTLAAVMPTFLFLSWDVVGEAPAAFLDPDVHPVRLGGLRGGSATFGESRLILRRYRYVPGVALSARIHVSTEGDDGGDSPVRLHVSGHAAARGWVRLGDRWTVGLLGGRRFRVRSATLLRSAKRSTAAQATVQDARASSILGLP